MKKLMEDCILGEGCHIATQEDCEELCPRAGRCVRNMGQRLTAALFPCPPQSCAWKEERGGGKMFLRSSCISHCPVLVQLLNWWRFCCFKLNGYCFPKWSLLPMPITGDSALPVPYLKIFLFLNFDFIFSFPTSGK